MTRPETLRVFIDARGVDVPVGANAIDAVQAFDAESGEAYYTKALGLAEARGMRPLVAHCHLGLGKLYRRMGDRSKAEDDLSIAETMYREMDMRSWLEQAEVTTVGERTAT